jgi:hypothetical protein
MAAATSANASCGDWLTHSGDMRSSRDHQVDGMTQTDPASANEQHRSDKLPLSKPCHGPLCRSAPAQPAPTAPASVIFSSDKLALFGSTETLFTDCRRFYQVNELDAHATRGFPARIDHPPRFFAVLLAVG